ncbi:glutaredoxin family protein [Massilia sp. W12]|uniref:glutaredoxin family protein n=1 Tax=Massilia sp. W12 TaxID=3126507 RepID=UPI0030D5CE58
MYKQALKTAFSYLLILAAGLGTGYAAVRAPDWFKSPYTEGNYSQHYAAAGKQIVVYGTQTCPFCAKTREYLAGKKINFADLDVNHDKQAGKRFKEMGGKAVPVILIGNRRIDGFNEKAIEEALQKAQKPV